LAVTLELRFGAKLRPLKELSYRHLEWLVLALRTHLLMILPVLGLVRTLVATVSLDYFAFFPSFSFGDSSGIDFSGICADRAPPPPPRLKLAG